MSKIKITNPPAGCTIFAFVYVIFSFICFGVNLYKAFECDWSNQTSWKPEIIHTVGIVLPPTSVLTVWYDIK